MRPITTRSPVAVSRALARIGAANEPDFPHAHRRLKAWRAAGAALAAATAAAAVVVIALQSSTYLKSIVAALLQRAIDAHLK